MKGTEVTEVAKRGCHEHGLAVVTRFGVASPLLFVLFVVLLEDSASGNSGPGRRPSLEQQSGLPRVSRRQMAFCQRVCASTSCVGFASSVHAIHFVVFVTALWIYLYALELMSALFFL